MGSEEFGADHLDIVEACVLGTLGGVHVHLDKLADVVFVALVAVVLIGRLRRHLTGTARYREGFPHRCVRTAVPELNAGQGAVTMHAVGRVPQINDVAFVPDAHTDVGGVVGLRADRAILDAHDSPSALRLHGSKSGLSAGPVGARAVAMRNLEESIGSLLRPDANGLEQDIVR